MKAAGHRRIALCTIIVAFTQGFRPLHGQTPSHRGAWSVAVDAGVPRGISPSMRGGTEEFRRELERDYTNSRYPFGDAGWSLSTFGGELAYAPGPLGIHLILQRASIEAGDDQGTAVMILNTASLGGEYMLGDRDARWGGFARMGLDVSMIDGYVENVLPTPSPLTSILQGSSIITHTRITTTIRYGAEAALGCRYAIPNSLLSLEASAVYMSANIIGKDYTRPSVAPPDALAERALNDGANPDDPSDHDRSIGLLSLRFGIRLGFREAP